MYGTCRMACTVYSKKYAHGFCFAVNCCGYTLTDFPISIRLTSLALWQSNDCPSASKATLMNMDKYFMWMSCGRLHNHNKAKHKTTVCIFLGIYCMQNLECGPKPGPEHGFHRAIRWLSNEWFSKATGTIHYKFTHIFVYFNQKVSFYASWSATLHLNRRNREWYVRNGKVKWREFIKWSFCLVLCHQRCLYCCRIVELESPGLFWCLRGVFTQF